MSVLYIGDTHRGVGHSWEDSYNHAYDHSIIISLKGFTAKQYDETIQKERVLVAKSHSSFFI